MAVKPHTALEKKAWAFALKAHEGVKRKFGGVPYFEHVRKVFKHLKQLDVDPELGAASLLHDLIEDTDVTYEIILKEFGRRVVDLVQELTSDDEEIKKIGKAKYLLKKMVNMSEDALLIKLCDRLQNVSDHLTMSEKFRSKYSKETKFIIDNLTKKRRLNRKHQNVVSQINGLLSRIERGYKPRRIKSFDEV